MGNPMQDREHADRFDDGDIVAILYRQHADITEALERVSASTGRERQANLDSLVEFLTAHEGAEQQVVRPVVEGQGRDDEADARIEEEQKAENVIGRLTDLDVDSEEFEKAFADFKNAVAEHAEREESDEFPILEERPVEERIELGTAFLGAESTSMS